MTLNRSREIISLQISRYLDGFYTIDNVEWTFSVVRNVLIRELVLLAHDLALTLTG